MQNSQDILKSINLLVETWCDRRSFSALRYILQGFPLSSGLTDDWANLLDGLENVRAFASDELTEEEKQNLSQLISSINQIVYR